MTARPQDSFVAALTAQLPALRRYARVLIGSATEADDLVQDCIERALRQWTKLEHVERIGGWLRSIVHNIHIDELRRKRRQGISVDLTTAEDLSANMSFVRDPAAAIDFDRALSSLTYEHRQILLLVGMEGLSYRETAGELGVPLGTVMSRLARARERLRYEIDFPPLPGEKRES